MRLSRRDFLKTLGLGAAAAGLTGSSPYRAEASETCSSDEPCFIPTDPAQMNSLFAGLETCCINHPLDEGEMRITFLGTSCTPMLAQQGVSVYVEVGPTHPETDSFGFVYNVPADYAMFDCGMGVLANYIAAGIPYDRMDKIFIAHLHADHMSELSAIYCFGESATRKTPLYVWGPSKSGVPDPYTGKIYEDGTKATLEHFREVWRWHTESFSFTSNGYEEYYAKLATLKEDWGLPCDPVPVGPAYRENGKGEPIGGHYADPPNDAYALIPIELDWTKRGEVEDDNVAYWNKGTGVKVTHFPAIHCRKGSIAYKLEFTPHDRDGNLIEGAKTLSMIYSGDTKPNLTMVDQASNEEKGIDLWIHEIVMPPDAWTAKFGHVDKEAVIGNPNLPYFTDVQNSSHTTQGAFGYLLSQINPRPRLTVATHFQATDDTIESARQSLDAYCIPRDWYTFALDFMVFNVTQDTITQRRLDVSRHEYPYGIPVRGSFDDPKYNKPDPDDPTKVIGDPEKQLDKTGAIEPGPATYDMGGYWPGTYDPDNPPICT